MNFKSTIGLLSAAAMLTLAIGCGKSKMLQASEDYAKDACDCKDAKCVEAATKKYNDAIQGTTPGSSEAEAIGKNTTKATECVTKAAMSGMGK